MSRETLSRVGRQGSVLVAMCCVLWMFAGTRALAGPNTASSTDQGPINDLDFVPVIEPDVYEADEPEEDPGFVYVDDVLDDDDYMLEDPDDTTGPVFLIDERTVLGHTQGPAQIDEVLDG